MGGPARRTRVRVLAPRPTTTQPNDSSNDALPDPPTSYVYTPANAGRVELPAPEGNDGAVAVTHERSPQMAAALPPASIDISGDGDRALNMLNATPEPDDPQHAETEAATNQPDQLTGSSSASTRNSPSIVPPDHNMVADEVTSATRGWPRSFTNNIVCPNPGEPIATNRSQPAADHFWALGDYISTLEANYASVQLHQAEWQAICNQLRYELDQYRRPAANLASYKQCCFGFEDFFGQTDCLTLICKPCWRKYNPYDAGDSLLEWPKEPWRATRSQLQLKTYDGSKANQLCPGCKKRIWTVWSLAQPILRMQYLHAMMAELQPSNQHIHYQYVR